MLTAGLCGTGSSQASSKATDDLSAAIVQTIGPHPKRKAAEVVFETSSHGKDLDPKVQMIVRKLLS